MSLSARVTWLLGVTAVLTAPVWGDDQAVSKAARSDRDANRVYGEWLIRVRPDQGEAYGRLIKEEGLPLFRQAGGRMVGWWKTLVGDLYEHVTIWEYDDMAAFEKAIVFLSKDAAFQKFVAARDPLLADEESRFLRLAQNAARPALPDSAPFVVHEIHRIPLARRQAYLEYMTGQGIDLLKAHGFRPAGPWVVDVGRRSEITYLFRFDSLAERERLIAQISRTDDGRAIRAKFSEYVEEVTTRILVPAPFALTPAASETIRKPAHNDAPLPHREEIAPGIHVAGFSDRFGSANCGWVALEKETLLIDLPRGIATSRFLGLVASSTRKPARTLVLTHLGKSDLVMVRSLLEQGITRVFTSPAMKERLLCVPGAVDPQVVRAISERTMIGDSKVALEFLPFDEVAGAAGASVHLPEAGVIFAGPLVVYGPHARLAESDTAGWVAAVRTLQTLQARHVVPGFGSWGGPERLIRQRRFLEELRRQVGYHVAQGRSNANLSDQVRLPSDCLAWMPYDQPTDEDIEHVYRELTIPTAPFGRHVPTALEERRHALVLIGDQPHEPGHLEDGLRPVFEATGVVPHFAVDVRTLSAENLERVQLLIILRDGLQRPDRDNRKNYMWMTPGQQRAVIAFVEGGGGFLNLHNAMGLYPDKSPYLDLVGGRYIGHGPLERFRVEVVDAMHPVTRGLDSFFVADEQHTPPYDEGRVHLLLRNRSDDGKTAAAGWVREQGRGRVCHLANGHTREALLHPTYQRLLRNAVRWSLRLEDLGPPSSESLNAPRGNN
jgi:hypothetical protein